MENNDYRRIERAIHAIRTNFRDQPSLSSLASAAGLSEFHFQRLFSRWAGISPTRFVQYLTADYAKARLRERRSVLDAAFESGLSGPGRMHDLIVKLEAMSPGEYKARGRGLIIEYGVHGSPFGDCFVALTRRGVCRIDFLSDRTASSALETARERWPEADWRRSQTSTEKVVRRMFSRSKHDSLQLLLHGSPFQIKVWEALLAVAPGELVTYGEIAHAIGSPRASRAVGSAVGKNPIAYLIPCHRVIRESGMMGEYRWGNARKHAMIGWEAATQGRR